jgi:thiamine pyrophosphate-dependent acetolactate synthase large subunit-like protein
VSAVPVYGAPLDGIDVVEVPPHLAHLFAEAHRRLARTDVGVHRGDGEVVTVPAATSGAAPGPDRWLVPDEDVVAAVLGAESIVVLAGPDVIALDAVPGVHALAAALSAGVLNTWGAKGLFDWRSRHHLATAGLQAWDFARAGFGDADLILATGVDEREASGDWRLAPVVEVHPWALGPLAERVGRARRDIPMPLLRDALAAVTQAGWTVDRGPLPPSRVTRAYGLALAGSGVVAADPGVAGFWVARTLPTSGLGGAQVPADPDTAGFALAAVIVAGRLRPGRPALAVVDGLGEGSAELWEVADRLGVPLAVEVWATDGEVLDADDHARRLERLLAEGGVATLATGPGQLDEMLAAAGPITAWAT